MSDVVLIILGMAAVTYGPRLFPFFVMPQREIPERLNTFLECIPATAIGALIIPGVFSTTPDLPIAAIAGICFTVILGLLRGGIIVPVLGAVAISYFVLTLYS